MKIAVTNTVKTTTDVLVDVVNSNAPTSVKVTATNVVKTTADILVSALQSGTKPTDQKAATDFSKKVNTTLKEAQSSNATQRTEATKQLTQWNASLPKCLQQNTFQECVDAAANTGG
ncbi:hypothetical protein HW130_17660 [Streptomyces sp. PKU-EA00015]|nr:hypothetical protein [Streptomyces sp. PKU-EA00015]